MWSLTFLLSILGSAWGSGELTVLQSPDSLIFRGQEQLDLSNVKNVLSVTYGFSVPEGTRWSGLIVKNPFHFSDAAVVVAVPGVASLDSVQGIRTYPLSTDQNLEDTWSSMKDRLQERFPNVANLTMNHVSLDSKAQAEAAFGKLEKRDSPNVEHLKSGVAVDDAFMDQINLMDAITSKIADNGLNNDGVPDIHWFSIPGLHSLVDTYGASSKQVQEAKRLLSSSVLLLSEVFETAYNDKVTFVVLSSDAIHTRRYKRQATSATATATAASTAAPTAATTAASGTTTVDENYPVMFNIFLWGGIAFFMALLAICVGIANMDPGRDSIIYRMTSNRMKKDN